MPNLTLLACYKSNSPPPVTKLHSRLLMRCNVRVQSCPAAALGCTLPLNAARPDGFCLPTHHPVCCAASGLQGRCGDQQGLAVHPLALNRQTNTCLPFCYFCHSVTDRADPQEDFKCTVVAPCRLTDTFPSILLLIHRRTSRAPWWPTRAGSTRRSGRTPKTLWSRSGAGCPPRQVSWGDC